MGQYMVPLLDIYLDIHKENRLEAQEYEIISDLMVWNLGVVLEKYLDQYRE